MPPSLLLVAPAELVSDDACREALPGAEWTRCDSVDAAEAYLSAANFDAAVVDVALAGAGARALRDRLGVPIHLLEAGDAESLRRALGRGVDAEGMLREVLQALGRAVHDANNPLTVITGNAQYALEMARTLNVDASLVRSVEDIGEAGRRLESAMAALSEVRRRLGAALETGDGVA